MHIDQNAIHASIKSKIRETPSEDLMSLKTFTAFLPQMGHFQLPVHSKAQESLDADTLRWFIQRELDTRKAGELPYTYDEMYLAAGIPKEFLR